MSQLDRLRGNRETVDSLTAALVGGRLSHAVVLSGPDGTGRGFAARLLAADFLYPQGGPGAKAVLEDTSPEVLIVAGEGKSGQIKVDRIREIRADVFRSALSAAGRVVWIRDAHRMGMGAANALLKVLEEPPADVLFILTTHDMAALPETIRSRCAAYPLAPVSAAECEAALLERGFTDRALVSLVTAVYGGRIGMGLRVLADEKRLAVLRRAIEAAEAAAKGDRYTLLAVFAGYEGRTDDDKAARELLLGDMADVLAAALRGGSPCLPPIAPETAAALLPLVNETRALLGRNVAYKIATTELVIKSGRAVAG